MDRLSAAGALVENISLAKEFARFYRHLTSFYCALPPGWD